MGSGRGETQSSVRLSQTFIGERAMTNWIKPPLGWSSDQLTGYLELAHANRFATFVNKRSAFDKLIAIDRCFMTVSDNWLNPRPAIPASFLFRSHAAFRGACEHATAGQIAEVFPLVRTTLEYAAYALFINDTPDAARLWLQRHNDAASKKAVAQAFQVKHLRAAISKRNRKAAEVFAQLYDRAVDFGAHPNERSITSNLSISDFDDRQEYTHIYLHGDGPQIDHTLKITAQCGVCALEILQEVYAARFELLGIRAELLNLRSGL